MTLPRRPGRRSAASLAVFPIDRHRPPPPPEPLSGEAKAIWRAIVGGFRHDWFRGSECLLETYCESAVAARQIADELSRCSIAAERYAELLRLYLSVAGTIAAIATKLRLSPQSSRDSRNVKHIPLGPYPWESRHDEAESDEAEPALAVIDEGNGNGDRNFSVLLQQQRARRGSAARATLATVEAADTAAFLAGKK